MAYVGTLQYEVSDQYTLASILQGETSDPAGQAAVADVMQNRLDAGGFTTNPNYPGLVGIALGPNQFQGQFQGTPSAGAMTIAGNALSGNLGYDSTGGALYYGAPAPGNASWLNSLLGSGTGTNIGGNTFSDLQGPASAGYGLDNEEFGLAATGGNLGNVPADTPGFASSALPATSAGSDLSSFGNMSLTGEPSGFSSTDETPSLGGAFGSSTSTADLTGGEIGDTTTPSLGGAFGSPTGMFGSAPTSYNGGTNAPGYVQPSQYAQAPLPQAVVQAADTQSAGSAQGGAATQAGLQSAASSVTGLGGMLSNITTSAETYLSNAFVVVAVAVLGIIFVAFGLGLFNKHTVQMIANTASA